MNKFKDIEKFSDDAVKVAESSIRLCNEILARDFENQKNQINRLIGSLDTIPNKEEFDDMVNASNLVVGTAGALRSLLSLNEILKVGGIGTDSLVV